MSVFLLISQQRRSHSVNHMKAKHVKLKTWPQKAWSPIFPNQTLLQISLFYTRIHVVWTNLASPASSALTGNHPLRRHHRPAATDRPPPPGCSSVTSSENSCVMTNTSSLPLSFIYLQKKSKEMSSSRSPAGCHLAPLIHEYCQRRSEACAPLCRLLMMLI